MQPRTPLPLLALLLTPSLGSAQTPPPREVHTPEPADLAKSPAQPTPVVEAQVRAQRPDVAASAAPLAAKPVAPEKLGAFERERVYHTREEDGTRWARGATYKARFGAQGTSYAPFLGVEAPRNFPVTFRIANVSVGGQALGFEAEVAAQTADDQVRYERGSLTEVYELAPRSIEQRFVFETLPAAGELVLRLSAESELEATELSERIQFSNALGAVHYGRATALDATGASVPAPTRLTAQGIEIRVPADFVASARFPLTIDPIISTFAIDTGTPNAFLPDCAYDASNGLWLVVHEEVFSVTDHDVVWRRMGVLNGLTLNSGYLDQNLGDYWANPACANNNAMDRFFVVAQVGIPGNGPRRILGRSVDATNGGLGTTLDMAAEDPFVDKLNPDVGGDPYGGLPSYFLVVWEKVFSASDHDIFSRLVDPGNSLASGLQIVDVSGSSLDSLPSISKSNDANVWNIAWQRQASSSNADLRGARVRFDGVTVSGSFSIDSSTTNTNNPQASTCLNGTNNWVVAYEHDWSTDADIDLALLAGTTVLDQTSLTGLEVLAGSPTLYENQITPDVDSDGWSFAVAYAQSWQGSSYDYDVFVATLARVGDQLQLSEGKLPIATSSTPEHHPAIASTEGAGLGWRLELIVLDDATTFSTSGNIEGGLYDNGMFTSYCHPGVDGVGDCPCGNPPSAFGRGCDNSTGLGGAKLYPNGIPSLGGDTMLLTSQDMPTTALTIFAQGDAVLPASAPFGQGVRCAGGTLKRLYMKVASGGASTVPEPGETSIHARSSALGDPLFSGARRSYYAYYRDPIVLGGCDPTTTFNTTQSVQAIWIP